MNLFPLIAFAIRSLYLEVRQEGTIEANQFSPLACFLTRGLCLLDEFCHFQEYEKTMHE